MDLDTLRKWESFTMKSQKYKSIWKRENLVKTNAIYFKAVAADITWIQYPKRGPEGIRGQIKHQAYATVWELSYEEVLAISKRYGEISKSVVSNIYRCKFFAQRNEEYKYFGVQWHNDAGNSCFIKEKSQFLLNSYANTSCQLDGPEIVKL